MPQETSFSQRWHDYRPTKGVWAWSCIACIVLTMIVGFGWGGWVTGGTAETMVSQATKDARQNLVANLCVSRFVASAGADASFAELKEASTYERDDLVEEGGWATIDGLKKQVSGAVDLCAERIAAMEKLPADRTVDLSPDRS